MNSLLERLLMLHDAVTLDIDFNAKIINKAYNGDTLIASDITFEQFSELFTKIEKLDQSSIEKLILFFNNLSLNEEPFSLTPSFEKIDKNSTNTIVKYEVKGLLKNNRLIMFFSRINKVQVQSYDPATKVFTRDIMIEKINAEIENKKPFALIILDLDNFKNFNDTYGHMFGDIILVETVGAIKSALDSDDYIGRVGGDEFLIIIHTENNEFQEYYNKCSKIKKSILDLSNNNIKHASVTATIGCSIFPKDGQTYDTLFLKSDRALYRGKKKGRNCFIIYTEELCGKIEDNSLVDNYEDIESIDKTSTNSQVVLGVYEILSRNDAIEKNINDALSLIGNFFLIERIHLYVNYLGKTADLNFEWVDARSKKYGGLITIDKEKILLWKNRIDKNGMIKLNQVKKEHQNVPFFRLLLDEKTKSILGIELTYNERVLGFIRFDTCSYTKFWQIDDINSLMIIAKILAVSINRFNEQYQLKQYMFHDQLTGLYTFNKFKGVMSHVISNQEYSLIYFDLIDFREVNRAYGINYGDNVLKIFAESIASSVSKTEIYCRVTEDRFLIYTPTHDKNALIKICNQIYEKTNNNLPYTEKVRIQAGIRLAPINESLNEALDKAYICLKKNKGNEKWVFYENAIEEEYELEVQIKSHMIEGIMNNEFLLYLQPKVEIKTKKLIGAEALSRWNFKGKQLLYPDTYIPVFEKMGFINNLDYFMFENVCKLLKEMKDQGKELFCISLNASRYQTNIDSYISSIEKIRQKYDIDPKYLEIEITERMYLNNTQTVAKLVSKLHALNYRVSMDDFGSGFSNLISLVQLDFDTIKLDRSLCQGIDIDKERHILTFIKQMTNSLDVSVLCEGIENEDIASLLESLGYETGQGYYYDKPLHVDNFKNKYLK